MVHFFYAIGLLLLVGCARSSEPPQAVDTLFGATRRDGPQQTRKRHAVEPPEGSGGGSRTVYARGLGDEEGQEFQERQGGWEALHGAQVPVYEQAERVLGSVYFDFDQANLSAESRKALEALVAEFPVDRPDFELLIVGRADWFGSESYNLSLGDRRAMAVVEYLKGLSVPDTALKSLSRGKLDAVPGKPGDAKELSANDRRSDIVRLYTSTVPHG